MILTCDQLDCLLCSASLVINILFIMKSHACLRVSYAVSHVIIINGVINDCGGEWGDNLVFRAVNWAT